MTRARFFSRNFSGEFTEKSRSFRLKFTGPVNFEENRPNSWIHDNLRYEAWAIHSMVTTASFAAPLTSALFGGFMKFPVLAADRRHLPGNGTTIYLIAPDWVKNPSYQRRPQDRHPV